MKAWRGYHGCGSLGLKIATISILVVTIYNYFVPFGNVDVKEYLSWYDHIVSHGRLISFSGEYSNYNPPYLYILSLATFADGLLSPLEIVKFVSIAGALFLACCSYVLLKELMARKTAFLAAFSILLLPAVAINSGIWGQCDAMYAGFIVLAVAFAMKRRDVLVAIMFGAAIAFKLQAILIASFGLFLLLSGIMRPWTLLISVVTYCCMMVPAWIAGRPMKALATIYLQQADYFPNLAINSPNIWFYIQSNNLMSYENGTKLGIIVAALVTIAIASIAYLRKMTGNFDLVLIALLSSLALPYFLPKMHERYFFLADVLSFLLACAFRSAPTFLAALLIGIGSQLAATAFLLGFRFGPALGGMFMSAAIILVGMMFILRAFPQTARQLPSLARSMAAIGQT